MLLNQALHTNVSGTFVQWISGAQLYLVVITSPEVKLSTASIFHTLNITICSSLAQKMECNCDSESILGLFLENNGFRFTWDSCRLG